MQREAVETSVRILREHAAVQGGKSRGRIILPCGTGKSRIALRIIENLTEPGEVSAVLCPSIALVAQLRREFLANSSRPLKAIAVCSDATAGHGSDLSRDQTADIGQASASEVKGLVTTDPGEIGDWIDGVAEERNRIGVIFGTYQSSHRIADALSTDDRELSAMVADEAHRTAGLRRIRTEEEKLRDFTVCHDDGRFPAQFRVYQTATPRVYDTGGRSLRNEEWVVRNMDDAEVFGVELYRKSYAEAVEHEWLTDYRIIALGVNDEDAYKTANELAAGSGKKLSTAQFLRGLTFALVMAGAARPNDVEIRSSINFMNTIAKSKEMTKALQSKSARNWVQRRLNADNPELEAAEYKLEHLDASSKVAAREKAKARLASASEDKPHGIINVGIFGEGTDAPSLSAVGFLEARKSPVDVIQAVGRVMRRSPGKKMGYIICPILIPPDTDAETWLRNSGPEDGWKELGQILLALRAHDSRIEDQLDELMTLYLPPRPVEDVATMVTLGTEGQRVQHHGHVGKPGTVERDVEKVLGGEAKPKDVFVELKDVVPLQGVGGSLSTQPSGPVAQRILSGKRNWDGSIELREDGVQRDKPKSDGTPGPVNAEKSKQTGKKMVNGEAGRKLIRRKPASEREDPTEVFVRGFFDEVDTDEIGIRVNLLSKSGLSRNRAERDVNILQDSIHEARHHLKQDELGPVLDNHFGLDALADDKRAKQADGCTIASLLLMNAAMLHQRIAAGGWLAGIAGIDTVKNSTDVVSKLYRQWNRITRHDFLPVLEPAIEIIEAVQNTGRLQGLSRALRHLAAEAELIAERYADLGADHAGPLFNKVMGNQASDGAYFTRPPAAALLARLALDAADGDGDWTNDATWKKHRTVDLACGSGSLLAAVLTEMKRRAKSQGANEQELADLQKLAVEELIAGLDFNPVSLQLAAAQLTAGNSDVAYRRMGLHRMAYGPKDDGGAAVGSLELLGQRKILPIVGQLDFGDEDLDTQQVQISSDNPLLEDPAKAARNARIVIMNPPFTNRSKMGEKFPKAIQQDMRCRADGLDEALARQDPRMVGFADKNSVAPLFVALADRCLDESYDILAMINPTIALTATSSEKMRTILAGRYHIHTLFTCHQPGQINLSQNTSINESMIIAIRNEGANLPTRIIGLDRMPTDAREVEELCCRLAKCDSGLIPGGWGEISEWPSERVEAGDWSAAAWRSPLLAREAARISYDKSLPRLRDLNMMPADTGRQLRGVFESSSQETPGSFPILKSKGAAAQTQILATPDAHWIPKNSVSNGGLGGEQVHPETRKIQEKAGYLLVTAGQDNSSARLVAVASSRKFVGNGWMPVMGMTETQAKAAAVFLNSTIGRIQLMRNPGRKLEFPTYSAKEVSNLRVPDLESHQILRILSDCWLQTAGMTVPQFRDGECEVRRLWDEAAAEVLGWDKIEIADLRLLLHREPHVRGRGYNQVG